MSAARVLAALAASALLVACGGAEPRSESAANRPAIARVHASKCGACHAPPEPGTHARETLVAAFDRHRRQNRVRLSPTEWNEMVDFLADPQNSRRTAITR
jgi:hypothetical protein